MIYLMLLSSKSLHEHDHHGQQEKWVARLINLLSPNKFLLFMRSKKFYLEPIILKS